MLPLPTLITPGARATPTAARDDDPDSTEDVIDNVVDTVDTPQQRAALAHAVIKLRDAGKLSPASPPQRSSTSKADPRH